MGRLPNSHASKSPLLSTLAVEVFTICIRMDVMLQLFQEFVTPQQKKLAVMVQKMGGDAALEDAQAMKELAGAESALSSESGHPTGRSFNFVELRQEIKGDPDEAIEKNSQFFDCKFDIQRRQIVEDVARVLSREGDRIISAVTAGPHDRIVDPVWREVSRLCVTFTPCPFPSGYL